MKGAFSKFLLEKIIMENSEYNKFQKLINWFIKYGIRLIAIIIMLIGISSIFVTAYFETQYNNASETTKYKYSVGIVEIIISVIVFILIAFLNKKILKKIPSSVLLILILIPMFFVYILWLNALDLSPINDQGFIHDMAKSFVDGEIKIWAEANEYLFFYPYQLGIVIFVGFFYKIFGVNYLYFQYFNAVCSIINTILLFHFSKKMFKNENIQKILVMLLSVFCLFWMFFNNHVYGNIGGLTFALLAILFTFRFFEKNKFYNLLFSGIFISIAIYMKSNYNIFFIGIILLLILHIIKKWNWKKLLIIPIFLVGYFSVNLGYEQILKANDVTLSSGVPMITFVYMGIEDSEIISPGWYSGSTITMYTHNNFNTEITINQAKELIKERVQFFVQNPSEFANFFGPKLASTWLNPTFQTIWCSIPGIRCIFSREYEEYIIHHEKALDMLNGTLYDLEENIFNIYQILVFIFAAIGLFKLSKGIDLKQAVFPIIFFGGFLFHFVWETKAIYVIQYYFILLPFAAYGLNYCIEKLISKLQKKKLLNEKND